MNAQQYVLTWGGRRTTRRFAIALVLKPAIILMDFRLPNVNGLEARTRLRTDRRTSCIPTIILTALSTFSFGILSNSGDACLLKPCTPDRLLAEVELVPNRRGSPASKLPRLSPRH